MSIGRTAPSTAPVVAERCSLSGTLDLVGERWTLLVLREALMGAMRFNEFRTALAIASNLLSARLGKLVDAGLMVSAPYQEPGQRVRHSYHLTPSGAELAVAISALQRWGDEHLRSEYGPVAAYRARDGRPVSARFVDENGTVVDDADVEIARLDEESD
jgi:DNA-binding HxlR family transcriptional regulator